MTGKVLKALLGQTVQPPPVWMMRQAGRHLPEYRKLRSKAGSFLSMCYTPSLAIEASLQPFHRYGVDAVIIFSDILLLLRALGQTLHFRESNGPTLKPLPDPAALPCDICDIPKALENLSSVEETIAGCRQRVDRDIAIIGFAGAPWTLSTYALQGRVAGDTTLARSIYLSDRTAYRHLIEFLSEAVAGHLAQQARAGADVLMLFDSWAGSLDHDSFVKLVVNPTKRIITRLRTMGVFAPVIGFPRKCGVMLRHYAKDSGVDCIGLDPSVDPEWITNVIPSSMPVQGNIDPLILRAGGDVLDQHVDNMLSGLAARPLIANLGHGVMPDTPVEHVARFISRIRANC